MLRSFNAAAVPVRWREVEPDQGNYRWTACDPQIEWCRARGLKVCCGPLLLLDPMGLPDWLCLYEGDFENLASCALEFVRAAVTRYRGKVDLWQSAGRPTSAEILSLSEEQKLRLAASAIEQVRSTDPEHPVLISFDQPWGEYLGRRKMDLPPLYFADAASRKGRRVAPTGTVLSIRLFDAPSAPVLTVTPPPPAVETEVAEGETPPPSDGRLVDEGDGVYSTTLTLTQNTAVALSLEGAPMVDLAFAVTPDQPPSITLVDPPERGARGALTFSFRGFDDYGVQNAWARIMLDAEAEAPTPPEHQIRGTEPETVQALTGDPHPSPTLCLPRPRGGRRQRALGVVSDTLDLSGDVM